MKTIICDMDDVSLNDGPAANGMNWIYYLHGKYPGFKITLFAIPGRSNHEWLEHLIDEGSVELAVHGNMHDENEVITQEMIDSWYGYYEKIYKGPNWKVTPEEKKLLETNGYDIIDGIWLDRPDVVHGHVWIDADWQRLESLIEPDTKFKWISEVLWDPI